MKVLLLGAGAMGAKAAETAAAFDEVTKLTVADRDAAAAAEVAARCASKGHALTLDVTDTAALKAAMDQADTVLNLVGPFFRFGVPILKAAIETRTPYLDICDDPQPTLDMLALDSQARAAQVPAIVGIGASPGISNLLAAKAHNALDTTHTLYTAWSLEGGDTDLSEEGTGPGGKPSAAIVHWMEQISGRVKVWRDGGLAEVAPLQPVAIDYPGIGRRTLWTVGHPEAVTLPRTYPGLTHSLNMMVMPPGLAPLLKKLAAGIDSGAFSLEDASAELVKEDAKSRASLIDRVLTRILAFVEGPAMPAIFALAQGEKDGRPAIAGAHLATTPEDGMAGITSVPLAIGLKLLAQGKIPATGVLTPEAAFDPDAFFAALSPYCTAQTFDPAFEPGGDVAVLTVNTNPAARKTA